MTRIDRLARSIGDLQNIVRAICAEGASLKATKQPINTSTAAGKAFLDMLGVFAKFDTNLREERQLEGIAAAKAVGVYKGRPATIEVAMVAALKAEDLALQRLPGASTLSGLQFIVFSMGPPPEKKTASPKEGRSPLDV